MKIILLISFALLSCTPQNSSTTSTDSSSLRSTNSEERQYLSMVISYIRNNSHGVAMCYAQGIDKNRELGGDLTAEIAFSPSGKPIHCRIVKHLSDQNVGHCACNWIKSAWKLPAGTHTENRGLQYTWTLRPRP